ncbi:sulfur oxidation c-type cytochrome SoxA [Sulfurimonas sp.]|jgi:sulfur-oxidizing protein SoxA|uniref:sulfur oxidation c-type cytochrome SoxA n=1 Tax=Sulfurimonas sp. TaxID=2022749 RepID=UPI0025E19170|nr:sulfur oxidation c-type cytochrome SoxA [Sulfurimonas sp.]MCK9473246.1 sulfur oxidation c-type cytochrome SoxA [Sulfurimonas sp.]
MRKGMRIVLCVALLSSLTFASEQFAMSDADRAMYEELLENNPADMLLAHGSELLEELGGESALAKYLGVSEDALAPYLAGFPRYIVKFKMVVSIDQMLQGMMHDSGQKPYTLKSSEMVNLSSYVKSIANDQQINIDINANEYMKEAYALGKVVFETKRGARGLSCLSCHNQSVIGSILRTQPLPDISAKGNASAATWPAYRMTKSALATLQKRFQGCMNNALLAVIPLGSKEMTALEVYFTEEAKGATIALPGLKR